MNPTSLLPSGPLVRLQLAADGQWETALHVTDAAADAAAVEQWLATASQNVAVEAFVQVPEGQAFLGLRLAALPRERQHSLVRTMMRVFAEHPGMSAAAFMEEIASQADMPLFRTAPAFLELGKVNAWRSFGSVVFWRDGSAGTPLDSFRDALAAHPRFGHPSALPYAVEFAFDGTLPHWCGLPVSRCIDGMHAICPDIVARVLASVRAHACGSSPSAAAC